MRDVIRTDFVRAYSQMMSDGRAERDRLIRERDLLNEALNEEFGVKGSSSYHGQPDPSYHRRYKEIDTHFRPRYDAVTAREEAWQRDQEMTIPEGLFVDSASRELKDICGRPDFEQLYYSSFIKAKAELYLARWKTEFNFAGLQHRLERELELFPYAALRSRRWHGIRIWQLEPHLQIFSYRSAWFKSLRESLGRLTAA